LRATLERKRQALERDGRDAEALLPEWAEGFRAKDLKPLKLAQSLAEALQGLIRFDMDRALSGTHDLSLEDLNVPRGEQNILGPKLLRSVARIPRLLGFNRLVLLIDEAEVAFEGLAQKRRQNLLGFLRFLNDHLAGGEEGAVILVACTDDFWPNRFNEYAALKGRLTDPGHDRVEDRDGLTTNALVNRNKLWVRETFRGRLEDYKALGEAILVVGKRVLPDLEVALQMANVTLLAGVASFDEVNRFIKRPFVKALAQLVQDQISDHNQGAVTEDQARGLFDLAKRAVNQVDQSEATGNPGA